ncbi:adenosylcobinamide-phosphate synthase CbiB [Paenibacillus chungangensis]|uniref:Cobalamin biosynthesis protein CobD n=1 Tax=Paenibacillus chungangensis TaxID=696535 RepID=A0ABW3HPX9_9BACL
MLYSLKELLLLAMAAIAIDWLIGDPRWPTHPVIWIGRLIGRLERAWLRQDGCQRSGEKRMYGILLTVIVLAASWGMMWGMVWLADMVHTWLGYAVTAWFISTTIAVKGLKEAAMSVYRPLIEGNLNEARKYVGYIVGRDTDSLDESEAVRATVETVAENTVDAFVSPILFALLGGAPLAMLYRAANTLDSMVGYRNDKYVDFGWCSARTDDVLNYIPARLTGLMMVVAAYLLPGLDGRRSWSAMRTFAGSHPSPNSGIPESAAAGALGVQLGGSNRYFGLVSERARMGWPLQSLQRCHIRQSVRLLYAVSIIIWIGVLLTWLICA